MYRLNVVFHSGDTLDKSYSTQSEAEEALAGLAFDLSKVRFVSLQYVGK